MSKRVFVAAAALCLCLSPALSAQEAVIGSLKGLHDITAGQITATAEMLDQELYAYRPTDEVRTMGEILGHIANAQYLFCSAAAGESNPNSADHEASAGDKAAIVAALSAAFGYCEQVYDNLTDAAGAEMVTFFGNQMAKSGVMAFNSAHNYEHYGNLVTYMRMNGITPPSSM